MSQVLDNLFAVCFPQGKPAAASKVEEKIARASFLDKIEVQAKASGDPFGTTRSRMPTAAR